MARRFNLTLDRLGFAVSSFASFCGICLMKNRLPLLIAALLISNGSHAAWANENPTSTAEPSNASASGQVQRQNIPQWVVELFSAKKLDTDYDFALSLNPPYLRGDFNGDGKPDIAVLVKNKRSGKLGIAFCHGAKAEVFIVGAGKPLGSGGDDFNWVDTWMVQSKRSPGKAEAASGRAKPTSKAVLVEKSDSGGGLIYWNGKKYCWKQQGD
jgi:hypothetical protein